MNRFLVIIVMLALSLSGQAQIAKEVVADTLHPADEVIADTLHAADELMADTLHADEVSLMIDSTKQVKVPRDWSTWRPNPQRALWLALVLPGAGQIYNRKYWKLPIFYGGFIGCIYALSWNNTMYKDYSQAYLDISDNDPSTASYNRFLHLGVEINSSNEARYKELFKNRKDKYRRWRDMSIIVMVAVYALSVIDAYVDAELSEFDISKDLSLRVTPTIISNQKNTNAWQNQSLGLCCSLNF